MVHDQLVDYISSQMKLGVSREAISSALVSAGWVAADVEDTIKKVESMKPTGAAATSSPAMGSAMTAASAMGAKPAGATSAIGMGTMSAKPAAMSTGGMIGTATATATATKPMGASPMGAAGPQVIKVSDLVSTTPASMAGPVKKADSPVVDAGKFGGKITGNTFQATTATATPKKGGGAMKMVGILLIIVFAAAAGYFYWQDTTLAAKVASLNGSSSQVNSQLSDLQSKLDSANSGLSQIAALKQANDDLTLNLSFFAASKDATTTQATIGGTLSTGNAKDPYKITTPRSADIYITNATAAKTLATLKTLVGSQVQVAGTYIPGSDQLTITSIIAPAQPATATSTPSSTPASTSTSTTKASTPTSTSY